MSEEIPKAPAILVRKARIPGYRLLYALYETAASSGFMYSMTVTMEGNGACETASVCDLSRSRPQAEALFRLLSEGTVTPCAITDVLDEIL